MSSELRILVDSYESIQRVRIGMGLRVGAVQRGTDDAETDFYSQWESNLKEIEEGISARMGEVLKGHPAWEWLSAVKGIGPTLGGKILGLIEDISVPDTVSKLWRFAGYAVINGERERPAKGEKLHYNLRLKTALHLAGEAFLRAGSPYRQFYDSKKAEYQARPLMGPSQCPFDQVHKGGGKIIKCSNNGKGHIHNAAMRKMIKVFLQHLWQKWREAEGLPTREIYVKEKLGHTGIVMPEDVVPETAAG